MLPIFQSVYIVGNITTRAHSPGTAHDTGGFTPLLARFPQLAQAS